MNYIGDTIGWADLSGCPVRGWCPNNCDGCYANAMIRRFKLPKEISFRPDWLDDKKISWFIKKYKRQPRIFVSDNFELFGKWIDSGYIKDTIDRCKQYPEAIFLFLTQNPARYLEFEFPDNCWLGTTVRTQDEANIRLPLLCSTKTKLPFASFEPLNSYIDLQAKMPKWAIIGCLTPYHKGFELKWARDLIQQCAISKIPVYVKQLTNLPDFPHNGKADDDMIHWPLWARKRQLPQ